MATNQQTDNLAKALHSFLGETRVVYDLASVLLSRDHEARVSYQIIEQIAEDAEEVLLLGYKWRVLVPARTSTTVDWENSIMLFKEGETYKLPAIVVRLVEDAACSCLWRTERAITTFFHAVEEPAWEQMADMVRKMYRAASFQRINGAQIAQIANEMGLPERTDPLITEFKGAGIMHPKPSLVTEMIRVKAPIYELNPSIFAEKQSHEL